MKTDKADGQLSCSEGLRRQNRQLREKCAVQADEFEEVLQRTDGAVRAARDLIKRVSAPHTKK